MSTGKFQSSELPHHEVNPGKLQSILIDAQKMAINGPNLFRTKDVEHCFKTVFSNTADYVVILPTGSGKSVFIHYPVNKPPAAIRSSEYTEDVFVVVVPLKRLLEDQMLQCANKNIRFTLFEEDKTTVDSLNLENNGGDPIRLVFVQVEHVRSPKLRNLVQSIHNMKRLGRIVFDEAHIYYSHDKFRNEAFGAVQDFIQAFYCVPKLYLTATVSLEKEEEFLKFCTVPIAGDTEHVPTILRYGAIPSNLSMNVIKTNRFSDTILHISGRLSAMIGALHQDTRYIIMCMTIPIAVAAKKALERSGTVLQGKTTLCHSKLSAEEQSSSADSWREGKFPIMVATSGFSTGIDYSSVKYVGIIYACYDLESLMQTAGRAGRDDSPALVDVVYSCDFVGTPLSQKCSNKMLDFLNDSSCRRMFLAKHLHGKVDVCTPGSGVCDQNAKF
jgi:ATP-dependent DNA helicase RecQ